MNCNEKYWLAFASIEKISSVFIKKIYVYFGDIEMAWKADVNELLEIEGITKQQFNAFTQERGKVNPDDCYRYIQNENINFITYSDERYPSLLKQIYDPPMVLFMAGDIQRCNLDKTLAVVGSRKASDNSKETLISILDEFYGTDICVVSGLAAGIDTVAHKAAIKNNLSTIGVIGGGFKHLYPASNRGLFNDIKDKYGAVLSEYWPTFESISWRFPQRNRIVSGISKGTLVAEAAIKSGALITAKLCLEQNRELMCIPGLISNPNTAGIYKLLKDGAGLVTNAQDILNQLNWKVLSAPPAKNNDSLELNENEKKVFDCIVKDSLNLDQLICKTNLNIGDLMVILTNLEIRGYIKQTDGDKYISTVLV